MWIRLKKSYQSGSKKHPIGKVLQVTPELSRHLIKSGVAHEHTEGLPPKKVKTEFFKPKIDNGNNR